MTDGQHDFDCEVRTVGAGAPCTCAAAGVTPLERAVANVQAWLDHRTAIIYQGDVRLVLEALRERAP